MLDLLLVTVLANVPITIMSGQAFDFGWLKGHLICQAIANGAQTSQDVVDYRQKYIPEEEDICLEVRELGNKYGQYNGIYRAYKLGFETGVEPCRFRVKNFEGSATTLGLKSCDRE